MYVFCVHTQIFLIMSLAFQRWIICQHKQVCTLGHGCILHTYADIPNSDFGLPTLDYLHTQAITLGHGCILRIYADISKDDSAFQRWIVCTYEQVPRDMDVFCVLTLIFLKYPFGLPTLHYLQVSILRFDEYVSVQNPTMERRLLLRIYREL